MDADRDVPTPRPQRGVRERRQIAPQVALASGRPAARDRDASLHRLTSQLHLASHGRAAWVWSRAMRWPDSEASGRSAGLRASFLSLCDTVRAYAAARRANSIESADLNDGFTG
ncbi:MAG: hypothetical protein ACXWLR_02280 [Myxococcales bacterium]